LLKEKKTDTISPPVDRYLCTLLGVLSLVAHALIVILGNIHVTSENQEDPICLTVEA
jgi:hypothetical protein